MAKIFDPKKFTVMPWKNGGGTTRELLRCPASGEFILRISIATVSQDGAFSLFPGIDRGLLILEGAGLDLGRETLEPGKVLRFPGEEPYYAKLLHGPVKDFNVMMARDSGTFKMDIISDEHVPGEAFTLIFEHPETLTLLDPGESYHCARGIRVNVSGTREDIRRYLR